MQNNQTTPKIYVACLAAYNNGILHGQWIDADQGKEGIETEIQEMLGLSPIPGAEEFAIHDYEGFMGLRLSEYEDIGHVAEMAAMLKEHGEAWAVYAEYVGVEYATRENFEEAYQGQWDSEEAYAEHLAEETMEIPEHLSFYIDYEKMARYLFINDYFSGTGSDHKVHVFIRS